MVTFTKAVQRRQRSREMISCNKLGYKVQLFERVWHINFTSTQHPVYTSASLYMLRFSNRKYGAGACGRGADCHLSLRVLVLQDREEGLIKF